MKTWKIITVLLAVLLLAGCVGCVSGATINSITLSLDEPETGERVTSATYSSGVIATTSWNPVASGTFDAEKVYTATITVEPTSSNSFASSGTIKLNGNAKTWNLVDGKITVSHTFQKTASAVTTDSIKLTLTKPLAANTPATTATISTPSKGLKVTSVEWYPNDSKFKLGTKYTATVVLESTNAKAYPISSSVTAKVNGNTAKVSDISTSEVTITYEFGETEPKGIADAFSFTIRSPVVGEKPVAAVSANSQSDKTTATLSWGTTSAFQPDTSYTATIRITAKDGYLIRNDATATVNGNTAPIIWESSTSATVTYTFAQIASVSTVNVGFASPATGDVAPSSAKTVTTTPVGAANSATVKWSPALTEGAFDAGVEYTATVTIPITGANAVFDKDTIVYINGEKAETAVSNDYKTITAVYTFPKTFFFPNPLDIIKEFFQLLLALFNPASYAFL